jgi:molybdopterin converting factor small subunit
MAEQNKPVQGTPEPAAIPNDAATLQMLVQLLLAERQEALQEREDRKRTNKVRDDQRKRNAEYAVAEKNKIQSICTHKKGGKGLKSPKTDYAVYAHTFTHNVAYIRCQICGAKWRTVDTKEFLVRSGQQIPNHTRIGWREALEMLAESTNTPSSSEIQMATQPVATTVGDLE